MGDSAHQQETTPTGEAPPTAGDAPPTNGEEQEPILELPPAEDGEG